MISVLFFYFVSILKRTISWVFIFTYDQKFIEITKFSTLENFLTSQFSTGQEEDILDWWTRFFETLKDMEGGGDTAPKSIFEIAKSMKSAMIEEGTIFNTITFWQYTFISKTYLHLWTRS